jgi:hypothetical protein
MFFIVFKMDFTQTQGEPLIQTNNGLWILTKIFSNRKSKSFNAIKNLTILSSFTNYS